MKKPDKMLKLIILLWVLLIFGLCNAQSQIGMEIDLELKPLVWDYIQDANDREVDVIPELLKIRYIIFSDIVGTDWGWTDFRKDMIFINPKLKGKGIELKQPVYHELSHAVLSANHDVCTDTSIMNTNAPSDFEVYKDPVFWSIKLNELFNYNQN